MNHYKYLLPALLLICQIAAPVSGDNSGSGTDQFMEDHWRELDVPGMAVLAVKDEKTIYEGYFGKMNEDRSVCEDTLFMLASVSKTITATAVLQLVEKGIININEDINRYLPFEVRNPRYPQIPITVKMLLQHTSGIHDRKLFYISKYTLFSGGGDYPGDLSEFMTQYLSEKGEYYSSGNFSKYQPGSEYQYSNFAIALLAVIVENCTGKSFEQYCRDNIFSPLGMEKTSWFLANLDEQAVASPWFFGKFRGHYGYPDYPSGQIRTSARQLAAFGSMWSNGGLWKGTRLLDSDTVASALTEDPEGPEDIGLIWHFTSDELGHLPSHGGDDLGVATKLIIDPSNHSAVIFLTNGGWKKSEAYMAIWQKLLDLTH
ncbi:MAG: serine hydrolase [Spirochaetales bacterium]|nr:serine hydrolase [Spirochaetales bacterium]